MPPMLVGFIVENINKAPVPFFIKPILRMITGGVESRFLKPNYKVHFDFLESQLASRPYLAGDEFSGADILISFQLATAKRVAGLNKEDNPKIWEYMKRCEARDAFKRAIEKVCEAGYTAGVEQFEIGLTLIHRLRRPRRLGRSYKVEAGGIKFGVLDVGF